MPKAHPKVEQTIYDLDGNVLHTGRARSLRAFVAALLKKSEAQRVEHPRFGEPRLNLRRAKLDGLQLTGLDFNAAKVDLSGASLTNCDFAGSNLGGVRMAGADLTGASFPGVNLQFSDLAGTTLVGASFHQAMMMKTRLTNANLDEADFTNADMREVDLSYARGFAPCFNRAKMRGAMLTHARFIKPDMRGTSLSQGRLLDANPTRPLSAEHQALVEDSEVIRSRGAMITAGRYDEDTAISKDAYGSIIHDSKISKALDVGGFVSMAMFSGMAIDPLLEVLKDKLGIHDYHGATTVVALSGVYIVKELLDDRIKEFLQKNYLKAYGTIGSTLRDFKNGGHNLMNLAVLAGKSWSLKPIKLALQASGEEAQGKGFWSKFKSIITRDKEEILLCDRRHLALALQAICDFRQGVTPDGKAVTIMRCDGVHDNHVHKGPCSVSLNGDGSMTALWTTGVDEVMTARFGVDGNLLRVTTPDGTEVLPASVGIEPTVTTRDVIDRFEKGLIENFGLEDVVNYNPDTHRVHSGKAGAIIVRRQNGYKLDNNYGPALVTMAGQALHFRDGEFRSESQFNVSVTRRQARQNKASHVDEAAEVPADMGARPAMR